MFIRNGIDGVGSSCVRMIGNLLQRQQIVPKQFKDLSRRVFSRDIHPANFSLQHKVSKSKGPTQGIRQAWRGIHGSSLQNPGNEALARVNNPELITRSNRLTHEMLQSVITGKSLACVVEDFTSEATCKAVISALHENFAYEDYDYAVGSVGRIGRSFSEITTEKDKEAYSSSAIPTIVAMRKALEGLESPIDQFRLHLQEAWEYGANFGMLHEGKKMFVGLSRLIEAEKEVYPHQDMVWWYANNSAESQEILSQLTMNVYLHLPQEGGELELWDWGFSKNDREQYEKLAAGSYGIDKSKLPPPDLVITPKLGQMILFDPGKLHCIRTGSGQRITLSSFVGFHGNSKPLTYWS